MDNSGWARFCEKAGDSATLGAWRGDESASLRISVLRLAALGCKGL